MNANSEKRCDTRNSELDSSLTLGYAVAKGTGPRNLEITWSTESSADPNGFCIRVEHANPSAVPAEAGEFPAEGVSYHTETRS